MRKLRFNEKTVFSSKIAFERAPRTSRLISLRTASTGQFRLREQHAADIRRGRKSLKRGGL